MTNTSESSEPNPKPSATEAESGVGALRARRERSAERGKKSKAGRDLPAAIAVGVLLIAVVFTGLFFLPLAFVAIVAVFAVVGCWEVARAFTRSGVEVPLVPLAVAGVLMPFAGYYGGVEAVGFALTGSALLIVLWRIAEGPGKAMASIMASLLILGWVPLLISFSILLFNQEGGSLKLATMLLLVVSNDTFGYLVGAFFGKHPMAPKISPKKSWEGFAGSVGGAMIVGILAAVFLLDQPWWLGLVLAVALVGASTAGDLSESMLKRELGIKDMSNILPGHGGVMDRLDSVVFAVPVMYFLSILLFQAVPGM
ncbi:phosphatidate cytidylyltransferase [Paeniglutamicibacter cryotolerans]|uniref:Phosphatidate cytidylyltransferase n=1 Tax=Paeniglutamicibacter cryotolerans TaxID=670079 RepID=A0A839QVT5_9MICC|nr:phosphatidate cytidylyltransferase [Paeniglutamicibacter cryotolerans]MBB2996121.1 phosphatidate cytidylyltransferase [Paeniglutamicibacter cryotolerans]